MYDLFIVFSVSFSIRFLNFYLFIYYYLGFWVFLYELYQFLFDSFYIDLCLCLMQVQEGTLIYSSHYGGQEWSQVSVLFPLFLFWLGILPSLFWSYFSFSFLSCKISGLFHLYLHPLINGRANIYIYDR